MISWLTEHTGNPAIAAIQAVSKLNPLRMVPHLDLLQGQKLNLGGIHWGEGRLQGQLSRPSTWWATSMSAR